MMLRGPRRASRRPRGARLRGEHHEAQVRARSSQPHEAGRPVLTRLRRPLWPRSLREERVAAPYVVTLAEPAEELSRHPTAYAALRAAYEHGPGARVWRACDLAELDEGGPLAEVLEG